MSEVTRSGRMMVRVECDFRFFEDTLRKYLGNSIDRFIAKKFCSIGDNPTCRVVVMEGTSEYAAILGAQRLAVANKEFSCSLYSRRRIYEDSELEEGTLFNFVITRHFEPEGELCGTKYTTEGSCPVCHCGETIDGPLRLDKKKLATGTKLAVSRSIAGEVVVTQAFVDVFREVGCRGAEFREIYHRRTKKTITGWYELVVTSERLEIVPPTVAVINLGDEPGNPVRAPNPEYQPLYQCPKESPHCDKPHTIGMLFTTELYLEQPKEEADIWLTRQQLGYRMGVLHPESEMLISPRFYRALEARKLSGYRVEVAHWVFSKKE